MRKKVYDIGTEAAIIIDELLVQMSDGYWEGDDFYDKYWKNFDALPGAGTLVVYDTNAPELHNPLFDKELPEILRFFAEMYTDDADFERRAYERIEEVWKVPAEKAKEIVYSWLCDDDGGCNKPPKVLYPPVMVQDTIFKVGHGNRKLPERWVVAYLGYNGEEWEITAVRYDGENFIASNRIWESELNAGIWFTDFNAFAEAMKERKK